MKAHWKKYWRINPETSSFDYQFGGGEIEYENPIDKWEYSILHFCNSAKDIL